MALNELNESFVHADVESLDFTIETSQVISIQATKNHLIASSPDLQLIVYVSKGKIKVIQQTTDGYVCIRSTAPFGINTDLIASIAITNEASVYFALEKSKDLHCLILRRWTAINSGLMLSNKVTFGRTHYGPILRVNSIDESSSSCISTSLDGTVRKWDHQVRVGNTGYNLWCLEHPECVFVRPTAVACVGKDVIVGYYDGSLVYYENVEGSCKTAHKFAKGGSIEAVALNGQGSYIAATNIVEVGSTNFAMCLHLPYKYKSVGAVAYYGEMVMVAGEVETGGVILLYRVVGDVYSVKFKLQYKNTIPMKVTIKNENFLILLKSNQVHRFRLAPIVA